MGDYISREEALMAVTRAKLPDATPDGVPIANGKRSVTDCVRRLKEIPAADVRPVVLCRDCKHEGLLSCPMVVIEKQQMVFINHDPEFFCASGERKK